MGIQFDYKYRPFDGRCHFKCSSYYKGVRYDLVADVIASYDEEGDIYEVQPPHYDLMGISVEKPNNKVGFILSFSGMNEFSGYIRFVIFSEDAQPKNFEFRRFPDDECYYGGWSFAREDEEVVSFDGYAKLDVFKNKMEIDPDNIAPIVYSVSDKNWEKVNLMEAKGLCNLGIFNINPDEFIKVKSFFEGDSKKPQLIKHSF